MSLQNLSQQAGKEMVNGFRAAIDRPSVHQELAGVIKSAGVSSFLTPERLVRIAITQFSKTRGLWECDPRAIIRCLIEVASLGLEPGSGPHAQVYLIPFKRECSVMVTYQGDLAMARRNTGFKAVEARPVYQRDYLQLEYGFSKTFVHRPYFGIEERGPLVGAYCMWKEGDEQFVHLVNRADIDKRAAASPSFQKGGGPWKTWFDEMAVKTAIKGAAKWWPKSESYEAALERAERLDARETVIDMPTTAAPAQHQAMRTGGNRSDAIAERLRQRRSLSAGPSRSEMPRAQDSAPRPDPQAADEPPARLQNALDAQSPEDYDYGPPNWEDDAHRKDSK